METSRPHPHLQVEHNGPVLTVTLDNRARLGAQTPSLWLALGEVAAGVGEDVRVVQLRSEGPAFSAGLDRRMLAPGGLDGEPDLLGLAASGAGDDLEERIAAYQRGFAGWRDCPAIVVAAVQGYAVGAGFQLALAADLRIVADDAKFVMGEVPLGMIPDLGGTQPLVAAVGYARALEICLTARPVEAAEAVAIGLANVLVPAAELDQAAADLAAAIVEAPAAAVRALKPLLRGAAERSFDEQLRAERTAQVQLLAGIAASLGRR